MKRFFMPTCTRMLVFVFLVAGILLFDSHITKGQGGVTLYTPYTKISVPPGGPIDYTIDVINNSGSLKNIELSLAGLPKGWEHELKAGGWDIAQISLLPKEKKSITLRVEVPLKVNKGSYRFNVVANGYGSLPITVVVSEQGTFKTELTTKQPNMEGNSSASFNFTLDLKNRTVDKQLYALMAVLPPGWNIDFKTSGKQVTSVQVEANRSENITAEINPPDAIEAGTYKIPVRAVTSTTSADQELEVVITGSYGIELTTPTGLLSTDITAGDDKRIELAVKNTGSSKLQNIKFEFTAPINWDVTFDPKTVEVLEPGKTAQVFATVKADKKAIAGDYVTNIDSKTPEVTAKTTFRISVKTSLLWEWVGVLIIAVALGSVYYLFRQYGRR